MVLCDGKYWYSAWYSVMMTSAMCGTDIGTESAVLILLGMVLGCGAEITYAARMWSTERGYGTKRGALKEGTRVWVLREGTGRKVRY
eukprot:3870494-Rhodomonas_salina.1